MVTAHALIFIISPNKQSIFLLHSTILAFVIVGVPPKESSFLINALLLHHYKRGAYYPRGGASEFAFHIIAVIEQAGGAVLVRAPVQRILLNQQGKAYGKGDTGYESKATASLLLAYRGHFWKI